MTSTNPFPPFSMAWFLWKPSIKTKEIIDSGEGMIDTINETINEGFDTIQIVVIGAIILAVLYFIFPLRRLLK